ncbi:hypothetical protein AB9N12_12580 [Bacteroides sp. AN502(2024)]|uniref:hypothetical protein n=1 Tax=Bacteroides sp. AN502(2024) TaxID=3160599 RepID=UPI00351550BD
MMVISAHESNRKQGFLLLFGRKQAKNSALQLVSPGKQRGNAVSCRSAPQGNASKPVSTRIGP